MHRQLTYALIAPLLLVAGVGCSGGGKEDDPSASSHPPSSPMGSAASDPKAPASDPKADRLSALTTLRTFTRALSREDVGGMQATLAPQVRVRLAAAGGCVSLTGRPAVVSGYAAQFSGPQRNYLFAKVTRDALRVRANGARATLSQRRPSRGRVGKKVPVHLLRVKSAWQVDRIGSGCKGTEAARPPSSKPGPGGSRPGRGAPPLAGPRIVHPRPGCSVVLRPQGPDGRAVPRPPAARLPPDSEQQAQPAPPARLKRPDRQALKRLCSSRRR